MTDQTLLLGKHRRPLLLVLALGLVLMLGAALSSFVTSPGLVTHGTPQGASTQEAQMPTTAESGMDAAAQSGIMKLMQRLQQNPADQDALTGLAEHFIHTEDWPRAETFALRAVLSAPEDTKALYMLGVIQHNQQRHAEAAANLEKVVAKDNDPAVRYSLGMLYTYYLNDPDKGLAQLQKALDNPKIAPELKTDVLAEIEKTKQHKAHTPKTASPDRPQDKP